MFNGFLKVAPQGSTVASDAGLDSGPRWILFCGTVHGTQLRVERRHPPAGGRPRRPRWPCWSYRQGKRVALEPMARTVRRGRQARMERMARTVRRGRQARMEPMAPTVLMVRMAWMAMTVRPARRVRRDRLDLITPTLRSTSAKSRRPIRMLQEVRSPRSIGQPVAISTSTMAVNSTTPATGLLRPTVTLSILLASIYRSSKGPLERHSLCSCELRQAPASAGPMSVLTVPAEHTLRSAAPGDPMPLGSVRDLCGSTSTVRTLSRSIDTAVISAATWSTSKRTL